MTTPIGDDVPTGGSHAVSAEAGRVDAEDRSLGQIVSELTSDLSTLMRQEVELAKAEVRAEGKKAGKAAGMLGGAGLAAWMLLLFASITLMWALAEIMHLAWAALIVTVLWGIAAAVLAAMGRKQLAAISPKPEHTTESLKEDIQWAKHPKS